MSLAVSRINAVCFLISLTLLIPNGIHSVEINKVDFFNVEYEAIFVVLRHGDRSPTWFYRNDPFREPINWPEGVGSLNKRGEERLQMAGSIYQSLYGTFLNKTNGWPQFVKSSPSERCQKSAQIFVDSLRRFSNETIVPAVQIEVNGPMLSTSTPCPASSSAWLRMIESASVLDYMKQKRPIILELQNYTDEPFLSQQPFTLRNLEFLATTLEIERDEYQRNVPAWAKDPIIIDELNDLKRHAYMFDWSPPVVQRLRAGLMLKDIQRNIHKFVDSTTMTVNDNVGSFYRDLMTGRDNLNQRFFLYSTHDVVQVVLLQALGLYDVLSRWPTDYSSAIVFELLKSTQSQYLIRIVYRKIEKRYDLDIPRYEHRDIPLIQNSTRLFSQFNCTTTVDSVEYFCTVEQFQVAIEHLIPKNWNAECLGHDGNGTELTRSTILQLLLSITVAMITWLLS